MVWTTSKTEKYPSGNYVILVDGRNVHSRIPDFDNREEYEEWYKLTNDYWLFIVYIDNKKTCLRAYKQAQQYNNIMNSDTSVHIKTMCSFQYKKSMKFYSEMLNKVLSYKHLI